MKIGVITGGHTFDVIGFHRLWRSFDRLDCYTQALEEWAVDFERYGSRYDVLVFYNMHTALPEDCPGGRRTRQAIDALGDGTGIIVMHHGILAFKGDCVWDQIVGMTDRTIDGYSHGEHLTVQVENPDHPVTQGIEDWMLIDETYDFRDVVSESNEVVLTVDHANSMSTMAWTRSYKDSRVLNFVFGHDDQAWSDPLFRTVLEQGVRWTASRSNDK
jgi:trehalose utilization protein